MRKLRGAVFGCGMISEFHLRGWQRIDEVQIVALGNRTLSRAEARRDAFVPGASVYSELSDLLAGEDLDFLDVLTPPAKHKAHCLTALDADLHVICQKPMADTLDGARELTNAFAQSDRMLAIHENHRYRPWFQEVVRRARQGFFGTIRFARFEQFTPKEPPETYKLESQRGILLEYGTHIVDMIHALFGPPAEVWGRAFRLNPRVAGESLVHVAFAYAQATACLDLAWKPSGLPQGNVTVIGDKGEAHFEGTMTRGESSRFRLVEGDTTVMDESRSPYADYVESFYLLQREFVAAINGQGPLPQPAHDNLGVLETTFAAYAAIDSAPHAHLTSATEGGCRFHDHETQAH